MTLPLWRRLAPVGPDRGSPEPEALASGSPPSVLAMGVDVDTRDRGWSDVVIPPERGVDPRLPLDLTAHRAPALPGLRSSLSEDKNLKKVRLS